MIEYPGKILQSRAMNLNQLEWHCTKQRWHEVCGTACMGHRKKNCHGVLDVAGAMAIDVFVIYSTSKSVYFTNSPFHKFSASAFRSGATISIVK